MYGNDLSSLKTMLNFGLFFFIKLLSNKNASASVLVVIVSMLFI